MEGVKTIPDRPHIIWRNESGVMAQRLRFMYVFGFLFSFPSVLSWPVAVGGFKVDTLHISVDG